jgi:hypothetical protein
LIQRGGEYETIFRCIVRRVQIAQSCAAATSAAAGVSLSDGESDTTMNYNDNVDELLVDAGVEVFGPVLAEI